ncbi:unnamed protein product [Calicophoron daubneyi]|uniref:ADF-H domain-containing protein n=1 Tax=Calicophoron daubneyi TaxID=300641 RepID=A0AAV2TSB1_CALDB
MASGIKPTEECITIYDQIKMKHTHLYAIYKVDGDHIKLDAVSGPNATYDQFLNEMKSRAKQGCYAVVDLPLDERNSALGFVSWVSDDLPVKTKMLYASSKDALRKKLEGLKFRVDATDIDELSEEALLEAAKSRRTI